MATGAVPARWLEVAVEADSETAEELSRVLEGFCPGGVVRAQGLTAADDAGWDGAIPAGPVLLRGYLPIREGLAAQQRQIEEAVWHITAIAPGAVSGPRFQEVREEDWANAWKRYYHQQRIGRRLLLAPTWEDVAAAPDDVVVRLDPGAAFGTGLHPSTRLALQLLEATPLAGARLLDVGTGSGVLAIAAARLGANPILAVDTDAVAVAVARENARVNGLEETMAIREGSLEEAASWLQAKGATGFDVVVANIIARVLTELASALTALVAPGGQLLLSGIIEPAEVATMLTYATHGFLPEERLVEGDWRALRLRREG